MSTDEHLAAFCRTLPQLRAAVERHGLADQLAGVLTEIRAGTPVTELLPRLGIPSDALRSDSQPAVRWPENRLLWAKDRPRAEIYVCPRQLCDRAEPREPGGPIPDGHCWIAEEPLRRERA